MDGIGDFGSLHSEGSGEVNVVMQEFKQASWLLNGDPMTYLKAEGRCLT